MSDGGVGDSAHVAGCCCPGCCAPAATAEMACGVLADGMWFIPEGETFNGPVEFNNSGLKWSQPGGLGTPLTLTYSYSNLLDGTLPGGLTETQLRAATEEAMGLWSQYAPIHWVEMNDSGPAASDGGYSGSHPQIRIGHHFIDGGSGQNVLAHAYFPSGSGLPGDVHFDNGNTWKLSPSGGIDIIEVMTHELGHSLGLGHEEGGNNAIMNPFYGGRFSGLGTGFLLQDDINGIRDVYGSGVGSVTPLLGAPKANADSFAAIEDQTLNIGSVLQTIVPAGSNWKYLDTGVDQGTAWKEFAFNDAGWAAGPAQLGYGEGDEATVVASGPSSNRFPTTYFRHHFNVAAPGGIESLRLRLLRDDGAAVYLNGVEIARSNLAAGAGYGTFALVSAGGAEENQFFEFNVALTPGMLNVGDNVLAVEVHQINGTSSDLSFDLELQAWMDLGPESVLANDTDPENQPLTAALVSGPTNGVLSLNSNGSFSYTPNANFFGTDTFRYRAFDGAINSQPTTVTITVAARPDAPQPVTDNYTVAEDSSILGGMPMDVAVAVGSTWKYLDNGTDQGTAWKEAAYNDAAWQSGAAELGYGDSDEQTVVDYANDANSKFATTYFRTVFNVSDLGLISGLTLRLLRDDAAAVYINGVEVFRDDELPVGAGHQTYATGEASPTENVFEDFAISIAALSNGANVIAVEVHQQSPTSSDVSFDLELIATDSMAVPSSLLAAGSIWKYLDDGSNQGTAWKESAYNDGAWPSGPAQLGYGEGDEATTVRFANDEDHKYVTTYFRKSFTVTDWSNVVGITLRLLRDDGAAVYLNGVEIARSNLAAGAGFNTLATTTVDGANEDIFQVFNIDPGTLPGGTLVTGTNVLAVEIHQAAIDSSDISFDAELILNRAFVNTVIFNDQDLDQTGMTATLVSGPQHGAFTFNPDGSFSYAPAANYNGPDSFTYRLTSVTPFLFVPIGAIWKYLDNGTDQGVAWRGAAYDDTTWAAGPSELGYGDGDEATVVGFIDTNPTQGGVQRNATTYFRHHWNKPADQVLGTVTMRVKRDDAAAVYVNGVEVYRDANLSPTAAFNTFATSSVADENAFITFNVSAALFVDGDNVIAAEVHQNANNSSDISFSLDMKATLQSTIGTANLTITPVPDDALAINDLFDVEQGQTLTTDALTGVRANDLDFDGDVVSAVLVTGPANGTLAFSADGSFIYNPAFGFSGTDSFTYGLWEGAMAPIISAGDVWKYLDNGSNQGVAWFAAEFNDSAWQAGPSELGYGDGDEATVVSFIDTDPGTSGVQRNATTYFRRSFTVTDAGRLGELTLRLRRDDAAAVYLNGVEVYRDANLPANAAFNAFATSTIADEDAYVTVVIGGRLLPGLNVIAAEVHQATAGSSDISFDLELSAQELTDTATSTISVISTAPPMVTMAEFLDTPAPPRIRIAFNENVSASLAAVGVTKLLLHNNTTGQDVATDSLNPAYASNIATWGAANLPDGQYTATLLASTVLNAMGSTLAADYVFNFHHFRGDVDSDGDVDSLDIDALFAGRVGSTTDINFDIDGDGDADDEDVRVLVEVVIGTFFGDTDLNHAVSIGDLTVLAENFGQTNVGWAQGDFNGDRTVSIGDLTLLAENFGAGGGPLTGDGDGSAPAGLAALGDGALIPNTDEDEDEDDSAGSIVDILSELDAGLR